MMKYKGFGLRGLLTQPNGIDLHPVSKVSIFFKIPANSGNRPDPVADPRAQFLRLKYEIM